MLAEACAQLAEWSARRPVETCPLTVHVNVAPAQLVGPLTGPGHPRVTNR